MRAEGHRAQGARLRRWMPFPDMACQLRTTSPGPEPRNNVAMAALTYPRSNGHAALRRGRMQLTGQIYLLTITTHMRNPVFRDFEGGCAASRAFENRAFLGDATMLAWVLMPDHAHWLLQLGKCDSLSAVACRLKSASGRCVNLAMGTQGPVWSRAFHDHAIRNDEGVVGAARYLVANPLRAGLVERLGNYPFWNSIWL